MSDIREQLAKDINTRMVQSLEAADERMFHGTYIGKVVSNKPTKSDGTCQVRVFGVYGDEILDPVLPWAYNGLAESDMNTGRIVIPDVGTFVEVRFDNGDRYHPCYLGEYTPLANVIASTELKADPKLPGSAYPDVMVLFKNAHMTVTQDRKNGGYHINHSKGGDVIISALGEIVVDSNVSLAINTKKLEVLTETVIPTGTGPLCALGVCPVVGIPHSGQVSVGKGPIS